MQDEERRELTALKQQLTSITSKLAESQKASQQQVAKPETINERATYNPFTSGQSAMM